MKDRSFKVISVHKNDGSTIPFKPGRYISSTPMGAAKKAFTKLCNSRSKKILRITIQESTSQSNGKQFSYQIQRTKLKTPIVRFAGTDKEFKIRYSVQCTSISNTTQETVSSSPSVNQKNVVQKGGSSALYEISRTQYLVVSSLEEICSRLKLRRKLLLRTKVRGKARIVGKTIKGLQQMRLQKEMDRILTQKEDQESRNAKSLTGNPRKKEMIQIAAGDTKKRARQSNNRERKPKRRKSNNRLFEWIMSQESLHYLHRNTGPQIFHDAKRFNQDQKKTDENNLRENMRLIVAFLSFCDSMHDFNDTRSLIKYHLNIPVTDQICQGFQLCLQMIQRKQNFSRSASILLLRNHFETMLFNYMYDQYPMLVENKDNKDYQKYFHYYCTDEAYESIERLFKTHVQQVTFEQIFYPFEFYARDIYAVSNQVMKKISAERSLAKPKRKWKRITNMMHYWDAMGSKKLSASNENEKKSFVQEKPQDIIDPRRTKFCIKDKDKKLENENVTLDIGCDQNNKNDICITRQKSSPVNTVSNLSYMIGLLQKHGVQKVFQKDHPLTYEESEEAFYPTSTLEKAAEFFLEKKMERQKRFKQLQNTNTSLGQLYSNLQIIYNANDASNTYSRSNENDQTLLKKYINLLLDMKRTGDWGQASWVYNNNINTNAPKVVFESGDKLSALYSIYLNNPTIFGQNLGDFESSSFGFFNPFDTQQEGGRGFKKGGNQSDTEENEEDIKKFLNSYAMIDDPKQFMIEDTLALKQFLGNNVVSYVEVAIQIFAANHEELPNIIHNIRSKTIQKQNEAVYQLCTIWLHQIPRVKSLAMFELTNFIELTMSSILSSDIEKDMTFVSKRGKDKFKGWFAAIYPQKFYHLRSNSGASFYKNETKLVELWINTYQHEYPSAKRKSDGDIDERMPPLKRTRRDR